MDKKMSIFGVGPLLIFFTLIYSFIIVFVSKKFLSFKIDFVPNVLIELLSGFLLFIGLVLFSISVVNLLKEFPKGKLMKEGIYSIIRNPLYASFICFLVPGIIIMTKNLLFFTIPFFMYIIFRILITKEEQNLEKLFGEEYLNYKSSVGLLFPKLFKKK